MPVKRICWKCKKEFWGGNVARYCSDICRPKVKRIYVYKKSNPEHSKKHRRKIKNEVLGHYGGTPPKCACCGEDKWEFLVIDHIGGGGSAHRRQFHLTGGVTFYAWLKRNSYPQGFRVLCDNCNMSLSRYGYCPHNKIKK